MFQKRLKRSIPSDDWALEQDVARALGISAKTVSRHVEHIYAKLEVHTRAGAVLFAMEHDLTS